MWGVGNQRGAAAELFGLTPGTVELQSAGPLSFGPSGVLFVGDAKAAKIVAINTEDEKAAGGGNYQVDNLSEKLSAVLGSAEVSVNDLAVNPETGNAFLSVNAGGKAAIARVTPDGTISALNLDKIAHASVTLANAPEDKVVSNGRRSSNPRESSITDIAYTAGRVLVTGLAAGDSPSAVREFDFPFTDAATGFRVEIYHAAHGQSEDYAPIQTFVPFNIGGEPSLLAGYVCTPLVKIPVGKFDNQSTVKGTTVAELGNRNRPLDMIVYNKDGKDYLLMANSARGVMKISTENIDKNEGLTEPVKGGGVAGQPYESIESLQGVVQLDKINDHHGLVVIQQENSPLSMKAIDLP
jgi:hypothetical protein